MRPTSIIILLIGLALVVYAFLSINCAIMADGMRSASRNLTREAAERMTTEELSRVFGMPAEVKDTRRWMDSHGGGMWAGPVRGFISTNVFVVGGAGLFLVGLGIADGIAWRRRGRLPDAG